MKKMILPSLVFAGMLFGACTPQNPVVTVPPTPTPIATVCTDEAKLCPDGTAVGRTGPSCSFPACPLGDHPTPKSNPPGQGLTVEDAFRAVSARPEVGKWYSLFIGPGGTNPSTGGHPLMIEEGLAGDEYIIHLYEDVPAHPNTFGYYRVNKTTGAVRQTKQ